MITSASSVSAQLRAWRYIPLVKLAISPFRPAGNRRILRIGVHDRDNMATILVLEDNVLTLGVIGTILRRAGHEVLRATDEAAAFSQIKKYEGSIDLLVADATMAGRTGQRMVHSLREDRPAMKVLFISGYNKEDLVAREILEPDDEFLEKPFTVQLLGEVVERILTQARGAGGSFSQG